MALINQSIGVIGMIFYLFGLEPPIEDVIIVAVVVVFISLGAYKEGHSDGERSNYRR